ncbi:MAG: exodeoxyribonuclease VII large subunit [Pseudohongiellaceae bacterium]|nr:exodeoxyribonuclease VII large subunit [Pseudohongiellaceae bacterium]
MSYYQDQQAPPLSRATLSVTSLNRMARSLLESNFPNVLVEGEISNLAVPSSGHWYFTLKDEGGQIRCAMFRNRNSRSAVRPRNGMQITLKGKLSIYEGRGDYQLIADAMEEAGDGALRRRFEQLKQKLSDEGLFEQNRKRPLPQSINHIAVVTSRSGAVIRDIISVLARRSPGTSITLLPVSVQGQEAPAEIARAIARANELAPALAFDVLIVGRGGGSLEDLQAFNEELVARAISQSKLTTVSAIGHETDFTIADFVADLRAPTPSAAAELLSSDIGERLGQLQRIQARLHKAIQSQLRDARQELKSASRQLKHPGRRLQEYAQSLDILEGRLIRATRHRLSHHASRLSEARNALAACSPMSRISANKQSLATLQQNLGKALKRKMQSSSQLLATTAHRLDSVSPLNTLKRGYSISFNEDQQVIQSSDDVNKGDRIRTKLNQGTVYSTVTSVEPNAG